MNLEKQYHDLTGKPCNILQLVKREPDWAANRIQEGERASEALRELSGSVNDVCEPLFTASDGGAMWCTMREKPSAEDKVRRLEKAIESANILIKKEGRI